MILRHGSVGEQVRQLQIALNGLQLGGAPLKTDGIYGPATTAMLRVFQGKARIPIDGVFGPRSAKALTYICVGRGGKLRVIA